MHRTTRILIGTLALSASAVGQDLFRADSKELGYPGMDVVVREVERRPRASVIQIDVNVRGSSVGGSMFVMCSIRRLAELRGFRHVVQIEDAPRSQLLIGFLRDAADDASAADPAFRGYAGSVLDLESFAPVCSQK